MATTNQKELEKKLKRYAKTARKASKGSRRNKKKLRRMAENDLISVISKNATNHPAWYTKLGGELIGLNFGAMDALANRTDLIKGYQGEAIGVWTTDDVIIYTMLTATADDTIRVAAQKIVNELRLVSGANTIYDVDDMIDYMLNIRSIWAALAQVRRALRCLNASDPYDIDAWRKYLMMALNDVDNTGTATGFSDEFRRRAANTVNWLNTVIKSVRFMMPGNFSLFERTAWMFDNIFVDGTGEKFGTKMLVAREVPEYTHAAGSTTHTATVRDLFNAAMTVDNLQIAIQTMITNFTTKVENVAIAGDLMKAYGMQSFYDPGVVGYDERPQFLYDQRALEQIQNADVLGEYRTGSVTYQYDGVNAPFSFTIRSGLTVTLTQYASKSAVFETKFVNTSDNTIEPGETLSLTRFKATAIPTLSGSDVTSVAVVDCGTEVVLDYLYVYGFAINNAHSVLGALSSLDGVSTDPVHRTSWMSFWSLDDYGPFLFGYDGVNAVPKPGGGSQWTAYMIGDMSNWALMSRTEQRQLHKTAILSMLTPSASVVQQAVAKL